MPLKSPLTLKTVPCPISRRAAMATLAVVATLPLATGTAYAQVKERTIKFAFQNSKGHPQEMGAAQFAALVSAKSGGKMTVKTFPGGTLGGDVQTVSSLQGGTMEMTVLNSGILSAQAKEFAIFDFPYLFNTPQEVDTIVDGAFGTKMLSKLTEKNLIGLAYWDLGFRNLTNSKKAVASVEDIAGLKIRVIQSPIYVDLFSALGANGTPMPFPELYPALEQKAIDGQENPLTVIRSAKLNEVQKHLTLTRHTYNPQTVVFSKKVWDTYSADEKKVITDALAEATVYQRTVSRAQADEALADLKKSGMQVTELSPEALNKLRDKVKPVIQKHTEKVGADTVNEIQSELAKLRK